MVINLDYRTAYHDMSINIIYNELFPGPSTWCLIEGCGVGIKWIRGGRVCI